MLALLVLIIGGLVSVVVGTFRAKDVHRWSARLRLTPGLWREWCIRFWYWDSMPARGWYELVSKRAGRPRSE